MQLPGNRHNSLPIFDVANDVILFLKYYDPKQKLLYYCGHLYIRIDSNPSDIISILNKRAGMYISINLFNSYF